MCEIVSSDITEAVTAELWRHVSDAPPMSAGQFFRVKRLMCEGKRGFNDKDSAKRAAKKSMAQTVGMHEIKPYKCPYCDGRWHLGGRQHRPLAHFERQIAQVTATLALSDSRPFAH